MGDLANHSSDIAAVQGIATVKAILEDCCARTGMGFAAVARVTAQRWIACQVLDRIEFGLKPGDELELKTTICDEIRQSGQAVVIDHVAGHDDWRTHHTPAMYGFQSYISVPIVRGDGEFFGTLCAIDPEPRDAALAESVPAFQDYARRIAAALDSASL